MRRIFQKWVIAILLVVVTAWAYRGVGECEFVGFDDVFTTQPWDDRNMTLLNLYSEMLSHVISRYRLFNDLNRSRMMIECAHHIARFGHWEWKSDEKHFILSSEASDRTASSAETAAITASAVTSLRSSNVFLSSAILRIP